MSTTHPRRPGRGSKKVASSPFQLALKLALAAGALVLPNALVQGITLALAAAEVFEGSAGRRKRT